MAAEIPVKVVNGGLSQYGATDTVPTNNLGTGTANSSTFLRGDSTWAAGGTTDWANPGTIGSTTPNTGKFTTLETTGDAGFGTNAPIERIHAHNATNTGTPSDNVGIRAKSVNRTAYFALDSAAIGIPSVVFYNAGVEKARVGYYNTGDYMYFSTAGTTERMRIDSSGNVIIGATSTSYKTHIQTAGAAGYEYTLNLQNNFGVGAFMNLHFTGSDGILAGIEGYHSAANTGSILFKTAIADAYAERMRLDENGNFGVDVVPPTGWTHADKATFANVFAAYGGWSSVSNLYRDTTWKRIATGRVTALNHGGGSLQFYGSASGAADTEPAFLRFLDIDVDGNLGVGTAAPNAKIEARTDAASQQELLRLRNNDASGAGAKMSLWQTSEKSSYGYSWTGSQWETRLTAASDYNSFISFYTHNGSSSAERVRIDAAGNVGIGTDPTSVPSIGNPVVGKANLVAYNAGDLGISLLTDSAATRTQQIGFGAAGVNVFDAGFKWDTTNRRMSLWSTGSARMYVDYNGNVGVNIIPPVGWDNATTKALFAPTYCAETVFSSITNAYLPSVGNLKRIATGRSTRLNHGQNGALYYFGSASDTAGTDITTIQYLQIDADGNTAIGNITPLHRLHMVGSSTFAMGTPGNSGGHALIAGPGSPVSMRETFGTDGTGWQKRWAKNQGGSVTDLMALTDAGMLWANAGYINVKSPEFGATGDGTTDDYTAVNGAIAKAVSTGCRRVYFPAGTYSLETALSISGDMHLFGDGPNTSIIKVSHTGNGITYTGTTTSSENEKLEVVGLGFRSNSSTADAAIDGTWTTSGGGTFPAWQSCFFSNVEIGCASTTTAFQYGIKLSGASHSLISNVNCFALESGTISGSSYGLHLTSCVDDRIENCTFHYFETGVYGTNTEGLHFAGNVFLSCLDGIKIETTLTVGKPGLYINRNHLNVGRYGIHVIEQVQCFIGDNLIYGDQRTPTAGTTFMGVRIEAGSNASNTEMQSIIHDNVVVMVYESVGTPYTTNYGYAVYGGTGTVESVIFRGNKSQACDVLIYLDSSTTKAVVTADNIGTSGETWSDNGTYNSLPYGSRTPTDDAGVTNITNANVTPGEETWVRNGPYIDVFGQVTCAATSANALTRFTISVPVPSNLSAATQLVGVMIAEGGSSTDHRPGTVYGSTASDPDLATFVYYALTNTNTVFNYQYRYKVI